MNSWEHLINAAPDRMKWNTFMKKRESSVIKSMKNKYLKNNVGWFHPK